MDGHGREHGADARRTRGAVNVVGDPVSLQLYASDPDGDALMYSAAAYPRG